MGKQKIMETLNTSIPDNLDMATAYSDGAAIPTKAWVSIRMAAWQVDG